MSAPLLGALQAANFGVHKTHRNNEHFGTLFWSLERLFGYYHRIMYALPQPRTEHHFLAADIESYIIRFRIVLNDIAYLVWDILPHNARGLKGPRGGTHPKNREMSIFTLADFIYEESASYPELAQAFASASSWMNRLRNDRDNVIHYKAMVIVFDCKPPAFAFVNAAHTMPLEPTPDGGHKIVMLPVDEFINGQMLALHTFMHSDLSSAIIAHVARVGLIPQPNGRDFQIQIRCLGIETFKHVNGIKA